MKHKGSVVLIFTIFLVIVSDAGYRRKNRRQKNAPGYRRHVVNDEDWEEYRPSRYFNRHQFRPWRRRFNLGFRNNKRWLDFDLGFDFDFDFGSGRNWYLGPNVCTHKDVVKNETNSEETEIGSHHVISSVICDDKGSSYKCTKSMKVDGREEVIVEIKECCPGYTRKEHHFGCPTAVSLKDLISNAKDLKLTKFLEAIDIAGLTDNLKRGNITVFAPLDTAFDDVPDLMAPSSNILLQDSEVVMVSQPLIDTVVSDLRATLLGHLSPAVYQTSRLSDEELIDTASPYKNKIRINFYDKDVMTANCIGVKSRDTLATNGVIHVVEKILEPVTKTLLDLISSDPQMSYLKTAIGRTGLGKTLRNEGQLTVFAPSDSAFQKLDPALLSRIMDGNTDCLEKLILNHISPHVICSSAIRGKAKVKNMLQKYINVRRSSDDKLFIVDAQAVDFDVMGTNGVLYIIDEVLVPDEALDVLEIARKSGASSIASLITKYGLAKTLQTSDNLTLFAPSDKAVEEYGNITADASDIGQMLLYHVVPSEVDSCNVFNDVELETLNKGKTIRINEYSSHAFRLRSPWFQTAQCANVKKANIGACNGKVYIIDKVLTPPEGKLLDVLASDSRFSELVQLVKIAEIGDQLEESGPFTVFAPTNEAFQEIDDEKLQEIVNNKDKLKRLLYNHIHKDQLCCSGLNYMAKDYLLGGGVLKMMSSNRFEADVTYNKISIGKSTVEECDLTATNGVIHVIDKVILDNHKINNKWMWWW